MISPYKIVRICIANSYKFAPRSGGGGVEGIGGSGERKKGSPLPLIPIPRGATVQPKNLNKIKDIYSIEQ